MLVFKVVLRAELVPNRIGIVHEISIKTSFLQLPSQLFLLIEGTF